MDGLEPRQREAISALMDGELAPEQVQQHLTALSQDREARRCWLGFHASRDALHTLLPSQLDDVDGWHFLGAVGTRLAGLMPDFDPRTYGCPKLLTPIEKSDAFEVRRENLKVYIRPKQAVSPKEKAHQEWSGVLGRFH